MVLAEFTKGILEDSRSVLMSNRSAVHTRDLNALSVLVLYMKFVFTLIPQQQKKRSFPS